MRKAGMGINDIKSKILTLKGREFEKNVNLVRKKYDTLNGTIKDCYPSVFTVSLSENSSLQTFSYYDVLCGNVVFIEEE